MQNNAVYTRRNPFQKPLPDMRKRAALVAYLVKHERHCDHYDPFLFSNDVKLWNLDLGAWDGEVCMKARTFLDYQQESGDYWIYDRLFEAWESEQGGISVGFAGRSSGHIALYGEPAANLSPDELSALDMPELRRLVRLVHAFDGLC